MSIGLIKNNPENSFYPVDVSEIMEAEKDLGLKFPEALVDFYLRVGYGFLKGSEHQVNRIMDPFSVRDFRLRANDFMLYPDVEIYGEFEENKLVFFEASESALMSMALNGCGIYCYDVRIADSLESFLGKISTNDLYYVDLLLG